MTENNATGILRPRFSVVPDGRKHKALKRRRAYQRNAAKWRAWRVQCASGRVVAARASEGRARPYELGDVAYALRQVLSRRAVDALAWVLACERGFSGKQGVVIAHAQLASLLGCCAKSAGDAMRELVELGLVDQRPHFKPNGAPVIGAKKPRDARNVSKWYEQTPAYETTARCRDVVSKRTRRLEKRSSLLVGKKYHPTESAANPPGSQIKGTAERPEQRFVASVVEALRPRPVRQVSAVVYDRSGGLAPGMLRSEVEARKLARAGGSSLSRRERERAAGDDVMRDPDILDGWTAYLEHEARKAGDAAS